jgi:hypothetical protein
MEPILQVLDAQWCEVASSPEARRALVRWTNDHEVLAGMRDLNDVLLSRRDPRVSGEVLSILARLAPTDVLATRTLLQMLLPGLVRLVGTVGHGDPEAQDEIVALAWERIRTYPTSRNGSVAANVVLDVRKQYVRLRRGDQAVALHLVTEPIDDATAAGSAHFASACHTCPVRTRCTTAKTGRVIVLHLHHDLLAAARRQADTDTFDDTYRRHRPMIERTIAWLVKDNHRRLRYGGIERNQLRWSHRCAAVNLKRLLTLGLTHDNDGCTIT